jgi:hypothetical protein
VLEIGDAAAVEALDYAAGVDREHAAYIASPPRALDDVAGPESEEAPTATRFVAPGSLSRLMDVRPESGGGVGPGLMYGVVLARRGEPPVIEHRSAMADGRAQALLD